MSSTILWLPGGRFQATAMRRGNQTSSNSLTELRWQKTEFRETKEGWICRAKGRREYREGTWDLQRGSSTLWLTTDMFMHEKRLNLRPVKTLERHRWNNSWNSHKIGNRSSIQPKKKDLITGISPFIAFCFIVLCKKNFFYLNKLKVCGNSNWIRSSGLIFPTAFAHFMSLCHMLVMITVFHTFSGLLCYICYGGLSFMLWF